MLTLAEVLRRHWPAYERQFGAQILPSHRRAVACILNCRTPALGAELYACPQCQKVHYVYHSCNHRACPQCGQGDAGEWLERQKCRLLPMPHARITFTVPEGLRPWLRSHQQLGYGLLLRESAGALQDVARQPKYLGAQLGILSVLHTWGRQLQFHPHVHCVVPLGGLRADGRRWCRPPDPDFFLPHRVLAVRCRARFQAALRRACPEALAQIPPGVWWQAWGVNVALVGSGEPALKYLAAYVYRTALGPTRILGETAGQLTFRYQSNANHHWQCLVLPVLEFIRRFLQHILPQGFQRIRYYGWLSPAAKAKWQRIQALLDWQPPVPATPPPLPELLCPDCGHPLIWVSTLARPPP